MRQHPEAILFLARSLGQGGAERQLVTLARGLAARGHEVSVAVLYGGGFYESELRETNIRLISLNKRNRWDVLPFLHRLVTLLRKEHPSVLHGYLGIPNILIAMLKPLLPGTRIVWGVRASNMDLSRYDWLSRLVYWLECRLSRLADLIIANSNAGKAYAIAHGFPKQRIVVIPNGIDTQRFQFEKQGRVRVRAEWCVREDEFLVGLVARIDPMKDHAMFLLAACQLAAQHPSLRFVCVGKGAPEYSASLEQEAVSLGLGERLVWAGARDDMPAVFSALDIATSTSISEGFPNSIAEAMACGVPCVVTDVGDSALIVGEHGGVVAPSDHHAMVMEIDRLLALTEEERRRLGQSCRARIETKCSVESMVQRTEQALGLT